MEDETLDQSCYDLLASEAALTSFFAIAKGDVEEKHWIRLGRPITAVNKAACLVSWSGSMFEYLMPLLVMEDIEGTLGSQTHRLVVKGRFLCKGTRYAMGNLGIGLCCA